MQFSAQKAAEENVPPGDTFRGESYGAAAVVDVVEPGTGEIKAMAVNRRYTEREVPGHTKVNLAIGGSSGFQGGSTFKVFVLAEAIEQGIPEGFTLYSPQQYTSKVFENYVDGRPEPYRPQNSGDSQSGTFDLRTATARSVNTYYVQLEERLSVDGQVEGPASLAESLGVKQFAEGTASAPLNRGGSFVLGGNEVSPLAMAGAYATFAARGLHCPPRAITKITDARGGEIEIPAQECAQLLEPQVADRVNSLLRGAVENGTGRTAAFGRQVAGKTGTTNGSKAAWFVGYTPQLATAVWIGDPGAPGRPVKEMRRVVINGRYYPQVYGGTIPARIFQQTMRRSLADVPEVAFERPSSSSLEGREVAVPDVEGLPLDVAESMLVEAGFAVRDGGRVAGFPVSRGDTAYTVPRAGREIVYGSSVTIYESNGRKPRTEVSPPPEPPTQPVTVEEPVQQPAQEPATEPDAAEPAGENGNNGNGNGNNGNGGGGG